MKKRILPFLLLAGFSSIALCNIGKKAKEVGASTNFWVYPADVIRFDDKSRLNELIDSRADGVQEITEKIDGVEKTYTHGPETYNPQDRHWQGLPSTIVTGNRLWSTWYTGGTGEPRQFNYIVLAYSDDGGKKWVDPYFVIDHKMEGLDPSNPEINVANVGVPNLWMDGDIMCLSYIQYGTWVVKFKNPGNPDITKVTYETPVKLTDYKIHKNPTFLTDSDGSRVMAFPGESSASSSNVSVTTINVSKDGGKTFKQRAHISSSAPNSRFYPESQIVELAVGKWMVVSRLEKGAAGGIETAISNDFGYTWEPYKNNLSEPFVGPGSKFHITRLSSGHILMINHDTLSERASICAYLSQDNGLTWPFKLVLDQRKDVSYPYAFEQDGKIFVSWDKGRYIEKEIRLSVITEADIVAGEFLSKNSRNKLIVSKLNSNFTDIVSVNDAFKANMEFTVGTESSEIRNELPNTITVTDSSNKQYTLNGVWRSSGYKKDILGSYYFTFEADLPYSLSDTYQLLRTKITLVEEAKKGIGTTGIVLLSVFGTVVVGVSIFFIVKTLRRKDGSSN